MASTNKCLAQSSKSRTDGNATKKRESLPLERRYSCAGQINQRQDSLRVNAAGYFRAIMRVKFEATDATGKVHKRSSRVHIYSHCVVIHFAAHPPSKVWPKGVAAFSHPEWGQSSELAERKAGRWRTKPHVEAIEILEARQV